MFQSDVAWKLGNAVFNRSEGLWILFGHQQGVSQPKASGLVVGRSSHDLGELFSSFAVLTRFGCQGCQRQLRSLQVGLNG